MVVLLGIIRTFTHMYVSTSAKLNVSPTVMFFVHVGRMG